MRGVIVDETELDRIDGALTEWRQGDVALGERWFVHVGDPAQALTEAAAAIDGDGLQFVETEVRGLAVVTQTCDVVRSCRDRPYIEVSPLVEVGEDLLRDIERGRRPSYAWLPALANIGLVVDLDRTMTLEKSVVARWTRTEACTADAEAREFAHSLARKRARPAFPDDFVRWAAKLEKHLKAKHERNSDDGRALRALREIRVTASPDWSAPTMSLTFWFVRDPGRSDFDGDDWSAQVEKWRGLLPPAGRFESVALQVAALEDLTGADYVSSDRLDLDHLSSSGS